MKDKTFVTLSGLFFLLFFASVITFTLEKPITSLFIRASNVNPSPLKSFVVVFPQVGVIEKENKQNGTKIKVSVYLRDINGAVLPNRVVKLSAPAEGVTITLSDTQTTNNIGQAQFFITSKSAGKVQLTAVDTVSNISIVNIPTAEFTE